jgi:addiction module HigA family antidote
MTRTPIHPGEVLQDELHELGLSAAGLARNLNVPTNRITGILNGRRAVTADTALRLGHWFGMSAEFWLNLQKQYELRLAEKQNGAEIRRLPRRKAA